MRANVKRWRNVTTDPSRDQDGEVDSPAYVEAFLDEIAAVCRKHGLSISHEDGHGNFELKPFDEHNVSWLRNASLDIPRADWKPR